MEALSAWVCAAVVCLAVPAFYQGIKAMQDDGTLARISAKYRLGPALLIPVEIRR